MQFGVSGSNRMQFGAPTRCSSELLRALISGLECPACCLGHWSNTHPAAALSWVSMPWRSMDLATAQWHRQAPLDPVVSFARPRSIASTAMTTRSGHRSEEHTSELQSLMRISFAVFCLNKKTRTSQQSPTYQQLNVS